MARPDPARWSTGAEPPERPSRTAGPAAADRAPDPWSALDVSPAEVVDALMAVRGAVHACVTPSVDGAAAAERGAGGDVAASGLAWSRRAAAAFGDTLEDVVLTTERHHHLARTLSSPTGSAPDLVYLCVQRGPATLTTARHELASCLARLGTADPGGRPGGGGRHRSAVDDLDGLPRRRGAATADRPPAPPPAPVPAAPDPVLTQRWAGDVDTVRRLLTALMQLE